MVLKCKLQNSKVRSSVFEKTDKVLVSFFQGFSVFNTSQVFFLLSFLGIIGLLIWLSQTSSSSSSDSSSGESSSESADESSTKKKKTLSDISSDEGGDEKQRHVAVATPLSNGNVIHVTHRHVPSAAAQHHRLTNVTSASSSHFEPETMSGRMVLSSREIDTIYESLGQHSQQRSAPRSPARPTSGSPNVSPHKQQQQLTQGQQRRLEESIEATLDMLTELTNLTTTSSRHAIDKRQVEVISHQLHKIASSHADDKPLKSQQLAVANYDTASSTCTSSVDNDDGHSSSSANSVLELYKVKHVNAIEDHFKTLDEISSAIKNAGLENSQLIFGIDFTISNLENGTRTFNGRSLHYCDDDIKNPYQKVIEILGKTLECFDVDGRIPAFGFGDSNTKDRKVFPFSSTGYCNGFKDVLRRYNDILRDVKLSGPTNFAPLIKEAIRIVKQTNQYHILVIVADGQVTNERQTRDAIVEASKYALSIIMVGVGDGPWDTMNEFDDSLPKRQFDNFQFLNYNAVTEAADGNPDEVFALHALMEIPDQYKAIRELGLLKKV